MSGTEDVAHSPSPASLPLGPSGEPPLLPCGDPQPAGKQPWANLCSVPTLPAVLLVVGSDSQGTCVSECWDTG